MCSLQNKTDKLQANVNRMYEYRTASIIEFTETWINRNDDNVTLHIDGVTKTMSSKANNMEAAFASM